MGFRNNCYATVWETDFKPKYAEFSVSINRKKQDGTFEVDFKGKVRLIGRAFEKVKNIKFQPKDRIRLLEVDVSCTYNKETNRQFFNFIVWDCEVIKKEKTNDVEIIDTPLVNEPREDDLPF